MKTISLFFSLALSSLWLQGQGAILWNEAVNGQISMSPSVPTGMGILSLGTNSILASVSVEPVGNNWFGRNDYFTFSIGAGQRVEAIFLTIDNVAVQPWIGSSGFGLPTYGTTGNAQSGELLSQMGVLAIPSGIYGMYMENNNLQPFPTLANYRLDFVLTAVPEPGTWALLGLGSALLGCATHRRRK